MRFYEGKTKTICVLALVSAGLVLPSVEIQAGPKKNFSVVGWVKSKFTPQDRARPSSQSRSLRPVNVELGQPAGMISPQVGMVMTSAYPSQTPRPTTLAPVPVPPPRIPPPPPAIGHGRPPQVPAPPPVRRQESRASFSGEPTVQELRRRAEYLARKGLRYKFGGDHPSEGGMDCSGTMQFLLKSLGYSDIPRTSYNQYEWLRSKGTLRRVGMFHKSDRAVNNLRPGDMIFWGGTYDSGHKVSHVMIYLGKSRTGKHYIFGARGKKVRGLNGSGVDVFEYKPRSTGGRLIGYGPLPGMRG